MSSECDRDAVDKLVNEIEGVKVQIGDAMLRLRNENSSMYKEKERAIQKIKDFRSEMSKRLDAFEKEALQSLDAIFTEYKENTESHLKEADRCLTSHSENLKTMTVDEEEIFKRINECKESKRAIKQIQNALHKLKVQIADTEFIPDSNLTDVISKVTTLGVCRLSFRRDPTVLYEVIEKREVRMVSEKSSHDCNITGAALMPDGRVLLADRSNKRLVRLDTVSNGVKDYVNFQTEPWSVCSIHASEAAVSFPEEQNNVKFIRIDKKMRISRSLKLRHTCRALAYDGEELLVTDQGIFVSIYTLDGTLLRKFSKNGHFDSRLTDFHSIAVKDNLIVVADWNEGLLAFDKNGQIVWKYDDRDLKRAGGLCFDKNGNVIACGSQSINLIQINGNGKKIGEIANSSNGLVYPTTVCFDEQRALIIVAQQEANTVFFCVR